MKADCHIHMVLDGYDWRAAIDRHRVRPDAAHIRSVLQTWQSAGYTYLRDGGDRWGVGVCARALAAEYGITYRTPLAPLCKAGHYGSFIGLTYETEKEFAALVRQQKAAGADYIKLMISGLMDFHAFGVLTESGLAPAEIRQLIRIAHGEGLSVAAHANGAEAVIAAAEAGLESVEHGAYLNEEALCAMTEAGTVWVPTLSTVGNLLGTGRYPDRAVSAILDSALENLARYRGLVAPGTDAGAWAVPHGSQTEYPLLARAGIDRQRLYQGTAAILRKF